MELIVTADDFGYSPNRDDVIIDCSNEGIVTGASLLVNGATSESAVKKARQIGLCMGLHLNLSEGIPISDPVTIPSLVCCIDDRFVFRGKEGFIQAEKDQIIVVEDIEREFRAQIERFIQLTGKIPPYFDGHQHVHVYPRFASTIAKVAEEYGISKTRFPSEDMDEVSWMNDNPRKPFRQTLYNNTLQSIPIYNRYNINGCYGIGSSISGNMMSVQRLINSCLRYPRCSDQITTIELMTHPAVSEDEPSRWGCGIGCDEFSQSPDREHEMKVLTDSHIREYLQDKGIQLCSYETSHIQRKESCRNTKRILMMLSLKEGTGNTITGTRIANYLIQLGYTIQMIDTGDSFQQDNLYAILHNENYNHSSIFYCLFCIHALRSGVYAVQAGVPYVMMLGGTDINVNVNDEVKKDRIVNVLLHASHIIAFTEDMKERTEVLLKGYETPPITVIPQSSDYPCYCNHELRDSLNIPVNSILVLLPSGIRPIKDILFTLHAFSSYHKQHPNCYLCIIGPILDEHYAEEVFGYLPNDHILNLPPNYHLSSSPKKELIEGVFYHKPIPHSRFLDVLLDVDIVMNSSISEGFPAVVIESWGAGRIMIARKNSGCAGIIKHEENGLLFETPEEFIQELDHVCQDREYRAQLERSSKDYYEKLGMIEKEKNLLKRVVNSF